jgi:hypothetical protein
MEHFRRFEFLVQCLDGEDRYAFRIDLDLPAAARRFVRGAGGNRVAVSLWELNTDESVLSRACSRMYNEKQ